MAKRNKKPKKKGAHPRKAVPGAKRGRPTLYSLPLAKEICSEMVKHGALLYAIQAHPEWPDEDTIYTWLVDGEHEEFSELYDRARKVLVEKEVEKILIISDEYPTIEQTIFGTKGREASYTQIDPAGISRNKLRVDTRKFLITKILPKFKDKLEVEAGPDLAQILGASMAVK